MSGHSGNVLGYILNGTTFSVHASNMEEVARFGSTDQTSHVRIYTNGQSNLGYILKSINTVGGIADFAVQGPAADVTGLDPPPSLYVQGSTGNVGVGTAGPSHSLSINGDVYLSGQIVQDATNAVLRCVDLYCGPIHQTMSSMQRLRVHMGKVHIAVPGYTQFGYTVSWPEVGVEDVFEVSGTFYMTGVGVRQYHNFSVLANTLDDSNASPPSPCLDVITHQHSLSSTFKTTVQVTRQSGTSVNIYVQWLGDANEYTVNMKLDVFAPLTLGTVSASPLMSSF